MAKCKSWQVCCLLSIGLLCALALIGLCIVSLVNKRCASGNFKRAAVSADSQLCSDIGRNMLQQGGSAADGAIAALLCTSVVNPQSMGLGGGSIFTIRDKTGKVKVFSSRETAPQAVKADLLKDCPTTLTFATGSQWIGVPGELRGYEVVHKRYGRLPWAKLFEPTIKLARDGYKLPHFLGGLLNISLIEQLVKRSPLCELFCHKNKTVLREGDILKFPKLAETMETIAEKGADAFYTGKIGLDLIQDIKAAKGTVEMDDLRSFQVREEDAWTVPLGNNKMHIPPPPAGGALLAFILSLMKEFSLSPKSMDGEQKNQTFHLFVEALKFANGQKRSISDPRFNNRESAAHLNDSGFIRRISKLITINGTHEDSYYNVKPSFDHFGTTHVSVLDDDGLAVSVTSTINQIFGAGFYSPRTGIILNNELADFCGRADRVRPGEQPPSSMSPTILEYASGGILAIGGSGGSMITSAMASSIINHLWLGMNLTDAIAAPIVYVDARNNVNFEEGFDETVIAGLKALGHRMGSWPHFFNVVNAVEKVNGCITAVSDKRKSGQAAGY